MQIWKINTRLQHLQTVIKRNAGVASCNNLITFKSISRNADRDYYARTILRRDYYALGLLGAGTIMYRDYLLCNGTTMGQDYHQSVSPS